MREAIHGLTRQLPPAMNDRRLIMLDHGTVSTIRENAANLRRLVELDIFDDTGPLITAIAQTYDDLCDAWDNGIPLAPLSRATARLLEVDNQDKRVLVDRDPGDESGADAYEFGSYKANGSR